MIPDGALRLSVSGLLLNKRRPLPSDATLSDVDDTEFTGPQPRSLASDAMLNSARSRIDPTCLIARFRGHIRRTNPRRFANPLKGMVDATGIEPVTPSV